MDTKKLVRTGLLLALALIFQIGFRQFAQPLVGPLVNMVLLLAVLIVGPLGGILIGVFTPTIAFLVGINKLLPLIPIIAIGNIILVCVYYFSNKFIKIKYNNWISIIPAAILKFGFLAIAVRTILLLFVPKVPASVVAAFSLPQLYTAIAGGILATIIYEILKKRI